MDGAEIESRIQKYSQLTFNNSQRQFSEVKIDFLTNGAEQLIPKGKKLNFKTHIRN